MGPPGRSIQPSYLLADDHQPDGSPRITLVELDRAGRR